MERRFSKTIERAQTSAVRDILKLTQSSKVVSFAGGLPAEDSFPTEAIRDAYERVFARGKGAMQYGVTEGVPALREWLTGFLADKGIGTSVDRLLLTTGSQQAIDLAFRVLIDPGDVLLVERPTYLAALQSLSLADGRAVEVDSDDEGMLPDDLEAKLRTHRPKAVYVIPTFSNPVGKTWSSERRRALAELARKYGALVIEDDPYGDIRFDAANRIQTLYEHDAALGAASGDDGNALYLGSFSKTVAPALRTGFAAGPADVLRMMAKAKQASDLHSSAADQLALLELVTGWDLAGHIGFIRDMYRERMEGFVAALKGGPLDRLRWNRPAGGMFLWASLPETYVAADLLKLAVEEGVAFVPGEPFYAGVPARNTLRLNFTHTPPALVPEALARLSRAIERYSVEVYS
ncbi:PLP-dependent aminotransferase family protein [Paenibacillus antri]|uniref:PLP-dependent aminotransferase family protein n=1 Tax=Paenibacillus antri TaxID=2582848 RepID=A0A5R9FY31_9BACL|nr:PLP-dependent aminotransferase family protein [Paenibacillus antri]TLS48952.1 PLP-dependent aminotransferase family protein [Paenibacillus antri]